MTDWSEFASFIEEIKAARSTLGIRWYQETFYRGHRRSDPYKLLPSLFRQDIPSDKTYSEIERYTFFEFRTRARQLYEHQHTGWDVLFHMQHHGVPTRLLDWSSVFGVALYFALLNHVDGSESTPCIWILDPYALNKATWGRHRLYDPKYIARDETINRSYDYDELLLGDHPGQWKNDLMWTTPLAIYTSQRSERMFAQSGFFTIHGLDHRPLEEIFAENSKIHRKVEIPHSAIPAAKEFLSFAGIGHRQLFPDLDGIARSVNDKFSVAR